MKRFYLLSVICFLGTGIFAQENTGEERTLSADSIITSDARLDSIYQSLPEVMITGERPVVKASQGKLVYDLPRLIHDLPVDNAYDAVKELPGVTEMNGGLQLAGQGVTVVLNGKVTTLSTEQLYALLRSIPASRIEKAEVMYNAPARYQVRGALINVQLKQTTDGPASWQGELYAKYNQKHYENFEERASMLYNGNKFSIDFLYSHKHGRTYNTTDKDAMHTLADGSVHPMTTGEVKVGRSHTHDFRVGTDYNIAKEHQLSFVYNGNYQTYHSRMNINGSQRSTTLSNSTGWLHNGRLDYRTPFGLQAGVELTYYRSPSDQLLNSRLLDSDELNFFTQDCQRINRWKMFLAQEHNLNKGWALNYGIVYTTSTDNSYQYYYDPETGEQLGSGDTASSAVSENSTGNLSNMKSRKREETLNVYTGFSKSFGNKLSLDASLAIERYKTPVWNQWDWYPTINLNYMPAPGHILQLALSSDKDYPDYWAVQDAVSYVGGGYSEIHGNPLLKPAQSYEFKLNYVLKSKYIFSTWFSHTKDYSVQTLYQSSQRLVEIYKYLNFDYQQKFGIQASVPFKIKNWFNSSLTLIGIWHHEKDNDFWDIPFNRKQCYGIAQMNNTFTLSTRPDLKLTVTGFVHSKAIQGIYDLPTSGNVNAALRYGFAKGKAILNLYCNDIFETGQISPRIRFQTQNVTNHYSCFREFGVSFTYKFGGYKEKQREGVDTSRFK